MSSSLGSESASENEAELLLTLQVGGSLIEHVSCSSISALSNFLSSCNREGKKVLPGRPRNLPSNPAQKIHHFLTLDGAASIIEHCRADQVISLECGMSIAYLQAELSKHKQWFPVSVPDADLSLMEYINSGSSGCLEHGYGEARDLVLGMNVVLADGSQVKCGGKVVKNVTGYDLPKLFCGAAGSLCLPYSAHLRLYALPECALTLKAEFAECATAFKAAKRVCASGLPLSCLEIVDLEMIKSVIGKGFNLDINFDSATKVLLFAQMHNLASVVEELEREFKALLANDLISCERLEEPSASFVWGMLSNPKEYLQTDWLELACPLWLIEKLASKLLEGVHDLVFSARPGRQKAFLACSQEFSNVESLQTLIADYLSKMLGEYGLQESSAQMAYSDRQYLRRMRTFPEENLVARELKHRIKHEFDPHGTLNPLVLL